MNDPDIHYFNTTERETVSRKENFELIYRHVWIIHSECSCKKTIIIGYTEIDLEGVCCCPLYEKACA